MTSTTSEKLSLIHRLISVCKECPDDPESGRLIKMLQGILDESSPMIWKNIEKCGGVNFTTVEEAINTSILKPGGVLMYVDKCYSYFQNAKDFEIYCHLHTRPGNHSGVTHYYFVPAGAKHNAVILYDETNPEEYKKLCKYLKDHLQVDPWDVQIIPSIEEDRSDIILKTKFGTTIENEQLLMAFKRYVRSQDKEFGNKINLPEMFGDEKIGQYIRLALSYHRCDTKEWKITNDYETPNVVTVYSATYKAADMSTVKPIDVWIAKNIPEGLTENYYKKYKNNFGIGAMQKKDFMAYIKAKGFKCRRFESRNTWLPRDIPVMPQECKTDLSIPTQVEVKSDPGTKSSSDTKQKYIIDLSGAAKDKSGRVYFIRAGETDKVKIGITSGKVQKRIASMQTSNSETFKLIGVVDTDDYQKLEKMLHKHFANKKTRGEWFSLTNDDIILALDML